MTAEERPVPDDEQTERLREAQRRRAAEEAELAETTDVPGERRAHQRRADKADYLRKKLEEQADALEDQPDAPQDHPDAPEQQSDPPEK